MEKEKKICATILFKLSIVKSLSSTFRKRRDLLWPLLRAIAHGHVTSPHVGKLLLWMILKQLNYTTAIHCSLASDELIECFVPQTLAPVWIARIITPLSLLCWSQDSRNATNSRSYDMIGLSTNTFELQHIGSKFKKTSSNAANIIYWPFIFLILFTQTFISICVFGN